MPRPVQADTLTPAQLEALELALQRRPTAEVLPQARLQTSPPSPPATVREPSTAVRPGSETRIARPTGNPRSAIAREVSGTLQQLGSVRSAIAPRRLQPSVLYRTETSAAEDALIDQQLPVAIGAVPSANQVIALAGLFTQVNARAQQIHLKPYVLIGQPLSFDAETAEFSGTIRIGVADLFGTGTHHALAQAILFQVLESDIADPSEVSITETSPPFATVRVRARSPRDAVTIRVASRFDPAGVAVSIPVEPTLSVQLDRATIQGFGLESARVQVTAIGGTQGSRPTVQLAAAPSAFFEESSVQLDETGAATVAVRSDGVGRVMITASTPGYRAGSASIEFSAPWRSLAAAGVGGVVGGLVRLVPKWRRNSRPARMLLALCVAALTGLLVFGLFVLGVNVLPFKFSVTVGDVFVFVVAAMGAWFGTVLFTRGTTSN